MLFAVPVSFFTLMQIKPNKSVENLRLQRPIGREGWEAPNGRREEEQLACGAGQGGNPQGGAGQEIIEIRGNS